MAIDTSKINFIDYLWVKKNDDNTVSGIRLSKDNLPTNLVTTDVINNSIPLTAGENVKLTTNGNQLVISAEGKVKTVNGNSPDSSGNVNLSYNDLSDKPTLPLATSNTLGGIKIGYSSTSNNLAVRLDNEKAYISLPDHLKEFYTTVVNKPVSSGFYAFQDTRNSSAKVAFGDKAKAYTWVSANNSGWAGQIGISFYSDDIAFRRKESGTFSSNWKSWIGIATKPWVDQNYSLKGHTHSTSEISGLTRDIFCIDLVTDWTANMIPLDGGQINLGEDLLTMVYGNFIDDNNYEEFGIMLSLNNGTNELWFALVNNITDEVAMQSDNSIYDNDSLLGDLNELSNYHIEVFSCTYEEASNAFGKSDKGYSDYHDITLARENLTYFCTIRLNEDKIAWIVEQ